MFKTNPEAAATVDRVSQLLARIPIGETLTYKDISSNAGCDIRHKYRYLLIRAVGKTEKELGCIFESVRSVGVKRLTAADSPEIGLAAIRGVRRKARKGARRLDQLNSNSLPDTQNKRKIAYRSILGVLVMMADGNKAHTIAAVVDPAKPIPPKDILQMFT